jgi:hypothetical protein
VTGESSTNSINVDFGPDAVSGEFKVNAHNECGDGSQSSIEVTIKDATFPKIKLKWDDILVCFNVDSSLQQFQWYKNDTEISGATKQFYVSNKESGLYYVITTDDIGCTNQSNSIEIDPLSTISIYPNPASEKIEISIIDNNIGEVSVEIFNSSGTTMETFKSSKTGFIFNSILSLSDLLPGIYMVEIKIDGRHLKYDKLVVTW